MKFAIGFLNIIPIDTSEPVRSRSQPLSWAEANGTVTHNVALKVRSIRVTRERRPLGLTVTEVHGLLRAAGESSHGLARHNYALVQLMLQTGIRVGEVAALRRSDVVLRDRAGTVQWRILRRDRPGS